MSTDMRENEIKDTYDQAVARFAALLANTTANDTRSLHQKTARAGVPVSTGYRQFAALEHAGILSRSASGTYRHGDLGWRIGLSGWGFGDVSPFAAVTVSHLKTHARRVAFLGIRHAERLYLTAYSASRGTSFRPVPEEGTYTILKPDSVSQGFVIVRGPSGVTEVAVLKDVATRPTGNLVLGLIALSTDDAKDIVRTGLLNDAAHRLRMAIG